MFGVVDARPSVPPSNTSTWSSAQIERLRSCAEPGTTASKLVATEQVEPTAPPVGTHGTVIGNDRSDTVAASLCEAPLAPSVRRTASAA